MKFAQASTAPHIQVKQVRVSTDAAHLVVHVMRPVLFTSELPGFAQRLLQRLPTLWSTICHNEHGLPFVDELQATEMGHVVEHVVLALLTEHGIYARGVTEWNWLEDVEGTFKITLSGAPFDQRTTDLVLARALELLENDILGPLLGRAAARAETVTASSVYGTAPLRYSLPGQT